MPDLSTSFRDARNRVAVLRAEAARVGLKLAHACGEEVSAEEPRIGVSDWNAFDIPADLVRPAAAKVHLAAAIRLHQHTRQSAEHARRGFKRCRVDASERLLLSAERG